MNLHDYLAVTDTTAVYPGAGTGDHATLSYLALGLAGETSEVIEKELIVSSAYSIETFALFTSELGDVTWYLARFIRELGIDPATFWPILDEGPVIGPDSTRHLVVAVGRVAEIVKKTIRDDAGTLTDDRRAALTVALAATLTAWVAVNVAYGLEPADVLAGNVTKLTSRRDRGVLHGSGDTR